MKSDDEVVHTSSAGSTRRVDTFYSTKLDYSRLGQYVSLFLVFRWQ